MRISHDTHDKLAIFTRPSWLVMIVGVVMLAMGVVVALVPAKATTLQCYRPLNGPATCEIVETRLLTSRKWVRFPVRLLKGAEAEQHTFSGKAGYYRLQLDIDDGEGPFYFAWYGNGDQARSHATAIDAFVAEPGIRALTITNDKRGPCFTIAGLLAFFGLVFVLWGSVRIRATFSRDEQKVRITHSGLFGWRNREIAMSAIKELEVAGLGGDCQLYILLHSGKRLDLSTSTDTEGLLGPRKVRESRLRDAERLRSFIQSEA